MSFFSSMVMGWGGGGGGGTGRDLISGSFWMSGICIVYCMGWGGRGLISGSFWMSGICIVYCIRMATGCDKSC